MVSPLQNIGQVEFPDMNCDTVANIFLKLVEIMKVISDQFLTRTNDIQGGRSFHELHETPGVMKLFETFVLYFSETIY